MFLFFIYSNLVVPLSLNDLAFGIWTGIETFDTRMIPLSKTWLQLVPEIHVYSDEIPLNSSESIVNSSNHLNIKFHEMPMKSHHLVGTKFSGKWNSVQSRHLFAVVDLYKRYPNRTWYILGDDDTYLYPEALISFLSQQDPNVAQIFGKTFYVFDQINRFFPYPEKAHSFVQGGAGILIPKKMMSIIHQYLPMCAEIYTGFNFPSDMRLSACIQRFTNMTDDIFQYIPLLHGNTPCASKIKFQYDIAPITLHHIVPPITENLWFASISIWKNAQNEDIYIDWNKYVLSELFIEIGQEGIIAEIQWGLCIYLNGRNGKALHSISHPEPIFDQKDTEKVAPKKFIQKYEGNFWIKTVCDDSLREYAIVFDSFLLNESGCVFRLNCPNAKRFIHNYPDGKSPLNITYEKEIEL